MPFVRRFTTDPGPDVLLEIEAVNILDLTPPAPVVGAGTGTAVCVGEFEDGPFESPTEIAGAEDYLRVFGGFGYTYDGIGAQNPCARVRRADNALVPEYWNGNGYAQIYGRIFSRLILCRVDTSVGAVSFNRRASLLGAASFSYNLEPGDTISFDKGDGVSLTATFTAAAANVTSGAGTYATGFVGGESLTLGYDDASDFTVVFLAGDQTQAQVIARINAAAGFSFADPATATAIRLTGRRRGSRGSVRVVAASAGVLAKLGLVVATTLGTGNVGDVDAVSFSEVKSIVEAAVNGSTVEKVSSGAIRFSYTYASDSDFLRVAGGTASALGFVAGAMNSADGRARLLSTAGTYATGFAGGESLQLAVDGRGTFAVGFLVGDQTQAQVIARINAAAGYALASAYDATRIIFTGQANGGSVRVVGASAGTVLTKLGLVVGVAQAAGVATGSLPAGTVLLDAGSQAFVTMQSVAVTASPSGYSAKVRHALDDGTGTSVAIGGLNRIGRVIDIGAFDFVNPLAITAALTEPQIDVRYQAAFDKTKSRRSVARDANFVWSARQSNAVRRMGRANAIDATANGCLGRKFVARAPMNTARDVAASRVAEPGVGATASDRVYYCYPNFSLVLPDIAAIGASGGAGFSTAGQIDVGADACLVSIMTQLLPEENPAQQTQLLGNIVGFESGANVQNFEINDYKILKRAGVCSASFDNSIAGFQSGVTSVDPAAYPSLVSINRRNMADYIQDTLALIGGPPSKKASTLSRRKNLDENVDAFLAALLSKENPASQRIEGYTRDSKSGNTADLLARGLYRIIVKVRIIPGLNAIVFAVTAGESVEVQELLAA